MATLDNSSSSNRTEVSMNGRWKQACRGVRSVVNNDHTNPISFDYGICNLVRSILKRSSKIFSIGASLRTAKKSLSFSAR